MLNKSKLVLVGFIFVLFVATGCTTSSVGPSNATPPSNGSPPPVQISDNSSRRLSEVNNEYEVSNSASRPGSERILDQTEAEEQAQHKIDEFFQTCPESGFTYTLAGSLIYEIENFDYEVIATKGRPTYIEEKNDTTWIGSIYLKSSSVRDFDILKDCWSPYYTKFNQESYTLSKDKGLWNLQWHYINQQFKKPSCAVVRQFFSKNKCGSR